MKIKEKANNFLMKYKPLTSLSDFLYKHFGSITFLLLILLFVLPFLFNSIVVTLISILEILFIILIFLNFIVRKGFESLNRLITQKLTLKQIVFNYLLIIFCAILFFAITYGTIEHFNLGHLQYGSCNSEFDYTKFMFNNTLDVSSIGFNNALDVSPIDRVYFSGITLLTVGYGDICPTGYSKIVSLINAMVGNLINIIVIGIAIGQYLNSKSKK